MQYYGDDPMGPMVFTISLALGGLTLLVLLLRLFSRLYVVKAVGADDILIVIACLLSWGFIVASILATQHGLGSHRHFVPDEELAPYLQMVWLSSISYNACLGFIKASVLAMYLRVGDQRFHKQAIITLIVVVCQASANVLLCIFQCQSIERAWDITFMGQCVDTDAFYIATAALNISTDCLTYVIPIIFIRHLHLPLRQKIGLVIMLCLGLFACISSIIRITFIPALLSSSDFTYATTDAIYWSAIETNVGILAASIPSFKPIAKRYLPQLIGEGTSKHHQNSEESLSAISQHITPDSRSGLVELVDDRRSYHGHGDIALDALYGRPIGINTKCKFSKGGHSASIANSDDLILPPAGKILAKTRISIRSD